MVYFVTFPSVQSENPVFSEMSASELALRRFIDTLEEGARLLSEVLAFAPETHRLAFRIATAVSLAFLPHVRMGTARQAPCAAGSERTETVVVLQSRVD